MSKYRRITYEGRCQIFALSMSHRIPGDRLEASHDARRCRTWSGSSPLGSPTNRRLATDGTAEARDPSMTPSRWKNLSKDRRAVTVSFAAPRLCRGQRATTKETRDDVSGGQVLKIQGEPVSREAALEERAHHIGMPASASPVLPPPGNRRKADGAREAAGCWRCPGVGAEDRLVSRRHSHHAGAGRNLGPP
jgi:hypothetical protein